MKNSIKMSLWVQVVLAQKYLNEYLKSSSIREKGLTPNDFFLLTILRGYEDMNFYELNKALPIDSKSLHKKINEFVERGLLQRDFLENGSSSINLTPHAREIVREIREDSLDEFEDFFQIDEMNDLLHILFSFNERMRSVLDYELSDELKSKFREDLL